MARSDLNAAVGVAFVVVGILVLVGRFPILELSLTVAAVVLLVLGVLVLAKRLPGTPLLGGGLVAIGVLFLLPLGNLPAFLSPLFEAAGLVVGVLLIVFGILRLSR